MQKQIAVIADQNTVIGFILSGTLYKSPVDGQSNYLIVEQETTKQEIQQKFEQFTQNPLTTAILISKQAADKIRKTLDEFNEVTPVILELPEPKDNE